MKRVGLSLIFLFAFIPLRAETAPTNPVPISGFDDAATFKLFKNESQIATIVYALTPEGNYTRRFTLAMAGQTVDFDFEVNCDESGLWKTMKIVAPTDTVTVTRAGDKAEYTTASQNTTFSVTLTDGHILYDNYGPVFEGIMVKRYDMAKKGKQTFSRFLVPTTMLDVELEFKNREARRIQGKPMEFNVFGLVITGIPINLWTDDAGKIYLMDVPIQYAAFVREGFEDLLKKDAPGKIGSKAEFGVKKQTVMIPMRDGVELATDLYFPDAEPKAWPVILVRTPYKKEMEELKGDFWAKRGFVTAIQDCRGRFASEGIWEPFVNEREDGYDTIEWLGTREWSTGKVGMIGASYVGWVQLWAASGNPPHLTTIIPNVAPPDPFFNIPYEYGTFFILGSTWWAEILEKEATGDLSGRAIARISERKYEQILKKLPVIDLDREIFGKQNAYWRKWIKHNTNDEYWEQASFLEKLKDVQIPVFLQSGWFDGDGIGSKLNYMALKEAGNSNVKLVLGPWGHTDQSTSNLGDHEFGEHAALDLQTLYLRWFDFWLKGIENGIMAEPKVQVFTMFSNQWLEGNVYPLAETRFTNYYLASWQGANTSKGDGKLVAALPDTVKEFDAYVYNPGDPTPWPAFYFKSKDEIEEEKKGTVDIEKRRERIKAFHNSVTDERDDILVFQTEPLAQPLTIAGPVSAILYASSSAVDTDWFVTLLRVNEKGELLQLSRGTLRARFRDSLSKPSLLKKNIVYRYEIDLWQTGITFDKGERIRVEVASALFPAFSRNLNTGGHNEMEKKYKKARQRVFHSRQYPSHIVLPVVDLE